MSKMIFVNLPVADLAKSMAFYEAVGFTNNPQFTNENAAAMMWSDTIVVMLLKHEFWKTFTSKTIPNAKESAQVLLCISMDNRQAVDSIVSDATGAGGTADPTPTQDMPQNGIYLAFDEGRRFVTTDAIQRDFEPSGPFMAPRR